MVVKEKRKQDIQRTLEEIKKLLILQLIINGVTSGDIARVLGIDSSTIRHMVSIRRVKKPLGKKGMDISNDNDKTQIRSKIINKASS